MTTRFKAFQIKKQIKEDSYWMVAERGENLKFTCAISVAFFTEKYDASETVVREALDEFATETGMEYEANEHRYLFRWD